MTDKLEPVSNIMCIDMPEELIALCKRYGIEPEIVLREFIADLCDITSWAASPRKYGYSSNGSDERMLAQDYYNRVGYS